MEHQEDHSDTTAGTAIVFPEESGSRHLMPDISERILDVDPEAPPRTTSTSINPAASTTSNNNPSTRPVLPTEDKDVASKRKIAGGGITYFSNDTNRQQTSLSREQREQMKSGKHSARNVTSGAAGGGNEQTSGQGHSEVSTVSVPARKSYLDAMTPDTSDPLSKEDIKEKQRVSYLPAIDSEAFEADEETGQAEDTTNIGPAAEEETATPIGAFSVTGGQATARNKTMLELMTPAPGGGGQPKKQQEQEKKIGRPSYLMALDEESGSSKVLQKQNGNNDHNLNDPQDGNPNDPQGPATSQFARGARDPLVDDNSNNQPQVAPSQFARGVSDPLVDGIQPLPEPSPPPVPSAPGAHSLGQRSSNNSAGFRGSIVIGDGDDAKAPSLNDVPIGAGVLEKLAVALAIHEDDNNDDNISVATPASARSITDVEGETKLFLQRLVGGSVVVVAAFLLGLGLALGLNLGGEEAYHEDDPTLAPTAATNAPTTIKEEPIASKTSALLARILPDHTLATIEESESSPQAKAYDWITEDLLEDPSKLILPIERIQQRFALATLYFSTGGDQWSENDRWLNHSLHECLWYSKPWWSWDFTGVPPEGFTYNDNPNSCEWATLNPTDLYGGHQFYRHLWQYENDLRGTLPPQLSLLSGLVSLYLFNNTGLVGALPSQLGQLERLRVFNVGASQFTGTLPSQLGAMISLKEISIFGTKIRGTIPPELGKMTLATLNLDDNLLTGATIPTSLLGMKTLCHLLLSNNDLSGLLPTELGLLSKLSSLRMPGNRFSGSIPSQVGMLTKLYNIWLHDNRLSGTLPTQLGNLNGTTADFKFGNNRLSGSLPTQLGLCTGAVRFEAQSNNLVGTIPTELGQWQSISMLYLQDNFFTGTIPQEIPSLTRVIPFWNFLRNGWIPDLLIQWRAELLPLRPLVFAVNDNRMSGTIPANFSVMQNLSSVQLTNNPLLSGTVPDNLCRLPVLPLFGEEAIFDCTELLCGCNCNCSDDAL